MALEKVEICPVCNGSQFKSFLSCKDYTTSKENFEIVQCNTCSLLITSPRPDANSMGSYYQSEEYISHTGKSHTLTDRAYLFARKYTLRWKSKLINSRSSKHRGNLLDFGCGTGEFLYQMSLDGWRGHGLEPSDKARAKAQQLTGLLIKSKLDEFSDSKFNVVTLWHVLEHIPDIQPTLKQISSQLEQDGIIFIAVPNYECKDAEHYQNHWAGYDVPRHLWHFSQRAMSLLLDNCNLRLTEIIPMKLDAFYVSLLSEKYKGGNKNTLTSYGSALRIGIQSNLQAQKNNNYSSLIYVARR